MGTIPQVMKAAIPAMRPEGSLGTRSGFMARSISRKHCNGKPNHSCALAHQDCGTTVFPREILY
jgi:hypothetical protein